MGSEDDLKTTPLEVKEMDISLHNDTHSRQPGAMSKLHSPPKVLRDTKTLPTCPKMALPTKKEFLATLETVDHPNCSICREPMTSPVRLPYQGTHEFCKACITEWYNQSNSTECPMCRQKSILQRCRGCCRCRRRNVPSTCITRTMHHTSR